MKITIRCNNSGWSQSYPVDNEQMYISMIEALKGLQQSECTDFTIYGNDGKEV